MYANAIKNMCQQFEDITQQNHLVEFLLCQVNHGLNAMSVTEDWHLFYITYVKMIQNKLQISSRHLASKTV